MKRTDIFFGRYYAVNLRGRPEMDQVGLVKAEVIGSTNQNEIRVKQHGHLRANAANQLELVPRAGEAMLIPHRFLCPWGSYEQFQRVKHDERRKQQSDTQKSAAAEKRAREAQASQIKDVLAKVRQYSKKPLAEVERAVTQYADGGYGGTSIRISADDLLAILAWSESQKEEIQKAAAEIVKERTESILIDNVLDIL